MYARITPTRNADTIVFFAALAILSLIVFTHALNYFSTHHHQDIDCHDGRGIIFFVRRDVSVRSTGTGWRVLGSDSGYVDGVCYVRPTKRGASQ